MLKIIVPSAELWDEKNQEFIQVKEQTLLLEHSLVSLSKWESTWCKAFLKKDNKTLEETVDYIRCMTITQNVNPNVYKVLTSENIEEISSYINSPMTATYFNSSPENTINRETVTSELIYYWMIALNIPFECQKWHLNRLLTLIEVCNIKSKPAKKMSRGEIMNRNSALNAARKKQLNTKG